MQTILGSGGSIGVELAKALQQYTGEIRLVSRNPEKVNPTDELFPADLMNREEMERAVDGSDVVYVTIGFPYDAEIWADRWPPFIMNLVDICVERQCRMVFFDNIYLYSEEHLGRMTEETPVDPPSRKGQIRAQIAGIIMDEIARGNLKALIARSADFYGPSLKNSILTETVFEPLGRGKKANWLGSDRYRHSFTYTPDAGKATALLGNTESAYQQVWHLPTAPNPFTGKEWVEAIADVLEVEADYRVVPRWMVRLIGILNPVMRESVEMLYQYEREYVFDSGKFESAFDFRPTSYEEGIREIVRRDYSGS